MQEDPNQPLEDEEVIEQPQPSQAPGQPEQEQEQEETPGEQPQPGEEQEEQEEAPPSRREQLRVQNLLKKYGPPNANRQAPSQSGPDFRTRVNADEDVYKDLEDTARQYGQEQYNAGQGQAEYTTWKRFLQMDENHLRDKYPELRPGDEKHHQVLENALQSKYLRFVGFDAGDPNKGISPSVMYPDISYAEFVESEMEFSDELASLKVSTSTKNIASQAARGGLRPDGSSPKRMDLTKDPSQMTDDELNAAITATMPRDARGRFTPSK